MTSKLSPQISLFFQPSSKVSPSCPFQVSKSDGCRLLRASRVERLSPTVSMVWNGSRTGGGVRSRPSSSYFPGQTSSVRVMPTGPRAESGAPCVCVCVCVCVSLSQPSEQTWWVRILWTEEARVAETEGLGGGHDQVVLDPELESSRRPERPRASPPCPSRSAPPCRSGDCERGRWMLHLSAGLPPRPGADRRPHDPPSRSGGSRHRPGAGEARNRDTPTSNTSWGSAPIRSRQKSRSRLRTVEERPLRSASLEISHSRGADERKRQRCPGAGTEHPAQGVRRSVHDPADATEMPQYSSRPAYFIPSRKGEREDQLEDLPIREPVESTPDDPIPKSGSFATGAYRREPLLRPRPWWTAAHSP